MTAVSCPICNRDHFAWNPRGEYYGCLYKDCLFTCNDMVPGEAGSIRLLSEHVESAVHKAIWQRLQKLLLLGRADPSQLTDHDIQWICKRVASLVERLAEDNESFRLR